MDGEEELVVENLYLALTRPVMMMGVPLDAAVIIVCCSTMLLLLTSNPLISAGSGGIAIAISRLIVRKDYNMFRILSLMGKSKGPVRNKAYWGGVSWSPLPMKALSRKSACRD